jgi:hypothetical protein
MTNKPFKPLRQMTCRYAALCIGKAASSPYLQCQQENKTQGNEHMAHTATFGASSVLEKLHGVWAFFGAVGNALIEASSHNRRLEKVQILNDKSDEELEALGIPRDRIVHHVFGDLLHI